MFMQSAKQKQNNLVLYRRRMGFTQKQVARLLGHADASMVSHYEHGRALPPLAIALSLEIIYRTPVAFLFPQCMTSSKVGFAGKRNHSPRRASVGSSATLMNHAHEVSSRSVHSNGRPARYGKAIVCASPGAKAWRCSRRPALRRAVG